MQKKYIILFLPILCTIYLSNKGISQDSDYLYYRNFVYNADGQACRYSASTATFTVFLNNDQSRVLTESAPRWDTSGEPNIDGKGTFGMELGNFAESEIQIADTVFVRFTCNETREQGELSDVLTAIPWIRFPQTLHLAQIDLPAPPENVSVTPDENEYRIISWTKSSGKTYSVYRRCLQDTLANGQPRMLYARIVRNLSAASFTDSTISDNDYAYIIYAVSDKGIISSHSRETFENDRISGFQCSPRTTTALLTWNSYESPLGEITGYNIYRRIDDAPFGNPIAYTGSDSFYIDSRLNPGATYHYKVKARVDHQTEVGESEEISAATASSQAGLYTYANLKTAVVIHQNTNLGRIADDELPKIRTMLDAGKLFYWRNSGMKLNIEFSYYPISSYTDFGDPGNTNVAQTVDDLKRLGVINTQYDIIFRITPAVHGYWSLGVMTLSLPGPARKTGFSQSHWPICTGVKYPGNEPGINYNITWIFVHEVQHAIDALYHANGHPEMYHGDQPWKFPVACGEHFDFQAKMFRTFSDYEELYSNWGDIYEAVDADLDGFPDDEPLVALDEARFGSNPNLPDSDSDGYDDRQEALDGTFSGSDPAEPDTDNDGLPDGEDDHPRYPVKTSIERFTPVIDGFIEDGWPLVNDSTCFTKEPIVPELYLCYDDDWFYIGFKFNQIATPEITFDFHSDGWWHSSGNTIIKPNPVSGYFTNFRSWDASQAVRDYSSAVGGSGDGMWDDDSKYKQKFHHRVIDPKDAKCKVIYEAPLIRIEMALPKTDYAGLTLQPGDMLGLNVSYLKIKNKTSLWATAFDSYDFVDFTLAAGSALEKSASTATTVEQFELDQNYPNPFNPETTLHYKLPKLGPVELVIYNSLGQLVRTLVKDNKQAGIHKAIWDGKNDAAELLPSGIYFYELRAAAGRIMVRKMVLIK